MQKYSTCLVCVINVRLKLLVHGCSQISYKLIIKVKPNFLLLEV